MDAGSAGILPVEVADGNSGGWRAGEPVVCILLTTFDGSPRSAISSGTGLFRHPLKLIPDGETIAATAAGRLSEARATPPDTIPKKMNRSRRDRSKRLCYSIIDLHPTAPTKSNKGAAPERWIAISERDATTPAKPHFQRLHHLIYLSPAASHTPLQSMFRNTNAILPHQILMIVLNCLSTFTRA